MRKRRSIADLMGRRSRTNTPQPVVPQATPQPRTIQGKFTAYMAKTPPVCPEPIWWRVFNVGGIAVLGIVLYITLRFAQEDYEWGPAWAFLTIATSLFWGYWVFRRWHPYAHVDFLLPDQVWWRRFWQSANIAASFAIATGLAVLGWRSSWEGFLAALMLGWGAILWAIGPHPNPIHGHLGTQNFVSFRLPIARRVAIFYVVGIGVKVLAELAVTGVLMWLSPSWALRWILLGIGVVVAYVSFVHYTNRYKQLSQAWRTVELNIIARIIESNDRFLGTGGITATAMEKVGNVTLMNLPTTLSELWYRFLCVEWVDLGTILEIRKGDPIPPVPLHSLGAWGFEGGPKAPHTKVRKGARGVQIFFRVAGDEGRDASRWSGIRKDEKGKKAARRGENDRPF